MITAQLLDFKELNEGMLQVPMTFAPVVYALLGIAAEHYYNFLHPIHWLIWMAEHDGRNPARYRR